jgi:hypothetical protein
MHNDVAAVHTLATFATVLAVLMVGHNLADHVLGQTHDQAVNKAAPTAEAVAAGVNPRSGWSACLRHVAAYHTVMAGLGVAAWATLPLDLTWPGLTAGLICSAVSHAFIDRRWPVRWLLEHTGSAGFTGLASGGMNGMYLADQALHHVALFATALIITEL